MKSSIMMMLLMLFPALIVTMPLSVGLDLGNAGRSGLAAVGAEGSVWAGRLADARFGAVPLGDVDVGLKFWSLVGGPLKLTVQMKARSEMASGSLSALGFQSSEEGWRGDLSLNRQ